MGTSKGGSNARAVLVQAGGLASRTARRPKNVTAPETKSKVQVVGDVDGKKVLPGRAILRHVRRGSSQTSPANDKVLNQPTGPLLEDPIRLGETAAPSHLRSESGDNEGSTVLADPWTVAEVVEALSEAHARNLAVMDVRGRCQFTSFMIVVEGRSWVHLRAVADRLMDSLKQRKRRLATHVPLTVEGRDNTDWMIADLGDIVVHFMSEEARLYYDLESLWLLRPPLDPSLDVDVQSAVASPPM